MKKNINFKMLNFLILILNSAFLISCSGGGGGGGTTGNPTTPTVGTSNLVITNNKTQIPLANLNELKTFTIQVKNTGTKATNPLSSTSTGQSQISVNFSDCAGKVLNLNESCNIIVSLSSSLSGVYSKTINVLGAASTLSIPVSGYTYNNAEIDYMITKISAKEGILQSGSWDFLDSDVANTTFIANALARADSYSQVALYTPNIDFTVIPFSSWATVDKALNFLMFDETDNTLLTYNKDSVGTDFDTTQTKWQYNLYVKPKQISPGLLYKQNEIYKIVYGTDIPNFTTIYDQYLDSRKIIELNNINVVTGSTSSIKAQLAFLLDDKRWPSGYFIENAMKEVSFLFESLNGLNKTTQLNELARLLVLHWEYTLPEIQNLVDPLISQSPNLISPVQNLKYNPTEFNYTSYQIPGNFPPTLSGQRNIQLWYINDYQNQGFGCRNLAYTVLNMTYAYMYGNWSSSEKTQVENLLKDGLIEMKQSYACKYNSLTKKYTSHIDAPNTYNNNNAIPIIAKIYHLLPNSVITNTEKSDIFNQLLQELATGGSIDLDSNNGDPLIRAEALDFLLSLK